MATVRSLACKAFRPEALDVHTLKTYQTIINDNANCQV